MPTSAVDPSKIVISGDGGSYTLSSSGVRVYYGSGSFVSISIEDPDRSYVRWAWNRAGTSGVEGSPYSITFLAGWAPGEPAYTTSVSVSDRGDALPYAFSFVYDARNGTLSGSGQGAYMVHKPGSDNDIIASKLTLVGEGGRRYTLTDSPNVDFSYPNAPSSSEVVLSIRLSATDNEHVKTMMNNAGYTSTGGARYSVDLAAGWNTVISQDQNGVRFGVFSAPPVPNITSATYDAASGSLVVTGTNFLELGGANNDIVASKFRLVGQGLASYTLTNTSNVDIESSTRFRLTLSAADRAALVSILNQNGLVSTDGHAYSLEAIDHWAAGVDSATNVAQGGNNPINVSNFSVVSPPPAPDASIPALSVDARSCGVQALPALIDLRQGVGPVAGEGLRGTLSDVVGQALRSPAVASNCGSVVLASTKAGNASWAMYVESFRSNDNRSNGAYAVGDGTYEVVNNGQALVLAPATVYLEQLVATLPGVQASVAKTGVITAAYGGQVYVVVPGPSVQSDAAGAARVAADANGRYHFIDAAGNNQVLNPAFSNLVALRNVLWSMDPSYSMGVQLDGTVSATLKGKVYTLVPDYTLNKAPPDRVGQASWNENPVRFQYVTAPGVSQGVSIQ